LHDKFKEISYLVAPTGGVGYRFVETPATLLSASAGVGGVWEKNPGADVNASGAVSADERLSHKLSPTATITQAVTALWKTDDFADALYTFSAGIAVTIVTKAQLKAEFGDKIIFWGGGCETQRILGRGTPAEVAANVRELVSIFKPGGGFVFNQVHNVMGDVPPENVVAMLDTAYEESFYD
jgi:hypothetical protein